MNQVNLSSPAANPRRGTMQRTVFTGALILLACLAPAVLYPTFLMKGLCFALFAMAFNLLIGYVGLLSFGHAAFFGAAAYIVGHALKVWGLPIELALVIATLSSAFLGTIVGWLAIRRQGIYFAMITLALSQVVYFVALQAPQTGGEDGLQAIPRGVLFGLFDLSDSLVLYYVVLAIFLACFFMMQRIVSSPFGEVLRAIRDNEPRAVSLGYQVDNYKLLAFTLSAGAERMQWTASGEVVLMTLLGGIGTAMGPVVGAFTYVALQNYLAPFGSWVFIIQGVVFVLCVLVFRDGIVGLLGRIRNRIGFN